MVWPSAKVTLPAGVPVLPEAGATVAVNVMLEPCAMVVAEEARVMEVSN